MKKLEITSPAFKDVTEIPVQYTCEGANKNPPLIFGNIPNEAQSLTLILDDPEAPNGVWDHWIIWDIDPKTTSVEEGTEPVGIHGKGSGGNLTYQGPCPPSGTHRYFFKIYALDTKLDLPEGASKKDVEQDMEGHILAQGELIGLYSKKVQ